MSKKQPDQPSYQEIVKQEYKKCLASPVYFMKKYVKIQHQLRGTILFNLYPFQEEVMKAFHDFDFNIILKSRQMGISTLVAAYSLWLMIFNKDKNILVISLKQDVAKEIITKVRFANDNLPSWLKVQCIEDNRLSLRMPMNCGHLPNQHYRPEQNVQYCQLHGAWDSFSIKCGKRQKKLRMEKLVKMDFIQ